MNAAFQTGDVLIHRMAGTYLRVGHPHPDPTQHAIWVQNCDATGRLISSHGRYLAHTTLAGHYRHHSTPKENYTR